MDKREEISAFVMPRNVTMQSRVEADAPMQVTGTDYAAPAAEAPVMEVPADSAQ